MARTLEEVAKLAGVSRSTVSRVVNNQPNVRPEVRLRVQQVVDQTGYQPNVAARSLASQRSNMIGLVIPRSVHTLFTDPYFPRLTQGVVEASNHHGLTLSLFVEYDEQTLFPQVTREGLMDGLVVQTATVGNELVTRLSETSMPFIVVGRPHEAVDVSFIDVDNVAGAYNAVTHLIRLGYARIATITGALDTTAGIDRYTGYCEALLERGHSLDDALIAESDFTEAGGYEAVRRVLAQEPDAIFAASDAMAYGALRALREAGLSVPNDVALAGFDDLPLPGTDPSFLTTVRQPIRRFGSKAVEMLLDIIEHGPNPPRRIIMSTDLVVRVSCGAQQRDEGLE